MSKLKSVRSEIWYKARNKQPEPLTTTMEGTGSATAELLGKQILVTLAAAQQNKYVVITTPLGFRVVGAHSIHGNATAASWQLTNTADAINTAVDMAASDKDIDHMVDIDDDYSTFLRGDDDLRIEITTGAATGVIVIDILPTLA
jgi:hypothetical protein